MSAWPPRSSSTGWRPCCSSPNSSPSWPRSTAWRSSRSGRSPTTTKSSSHPSSVWEVPRRRTATGSTSRWPSPSTARTSPSPSSSWPWPTNARTSSSPPGPTSPSTAPNSASWPSSSPRPAPWATTRGDSIRLSRFQASLWEDLQRLGVVTAQAREWEDSVRALSGASTRIEHAVPDSLHATLRPYQLTGFNWLAYLYEHRLGGVLADDMGLGKTIQALALMCHTKERGLTRVAVPGGGADQRRRQLGGRVPTIRARARCRHRHRDRGAAGASPWRSWPPTSTSSSPPTPSSASSTTTTRPSTGPASSSTRPSSPRTGPPRPTGGPRCCRRRSRWP